MQVTAHVRFTILLLRASARCNQSILFQSTAKGAGRVHIVEMFGAMMPTSTPWLVV